MKENGISRKFQVVVIGDSQANEEQSEIAFEIGKSIAEKGGVLISGGRGGVMESANRGAKSAGGLTVSILPYESLDMANKYSDIVIPTGIGWARNLVNVLCGDLVIAIGGGSGTLSELAYAWQTGKKIVAFSKSEGWSKKIAGKKLDNRRQDSIIEASSVEEIKRQIELAFNQFGSH